MRPPFVRAYARSALRVGRAPLRRRSLTSDRCTSHAAGAWRERAHAASSPDGRCVTRGQKTDTEWRHGMLCGRRISLQTTTRSRRRRLASLGVAVAWLTRTTKTRASPRAGARSRRARTRGATCPSWPRCALPCGARRRCLSVPSTPATGRLSRKTAGVRMCVHGHEQVREPVRGHEVRASRPEPSTRSQPAVSTSRAFRNSASTASRPAVGASPRPSALHAQRGAAASPRAGCGWACSRPSRSRRAARPSYEDERPRRSGRRRGERRGTPPADLDPLRAQGLREHGGGVERGVLERHEAIERAASPGRGIRRASITFCAERTVQGEGRARPSARAGGGLRVDAI